MPASATQHALTASALTISSAREPWRSNSGPMNGAESAPSNAPTDTAPEIPVRDQPNSPAIGTMKMESVVTEAAWRTAFEHIAQPTAAQP